MQRTTPAADRAIAHVVAMLDASGEGTARLPGMRELALRADVSVPTMWKALSELRRQGRIVGRQGSGFYRPGGGPDAAVPHQRTRHEHLVQRVSSDIREGAFHDEEFLPSMKSLCERYGHAYSSVKRAAVRVEDLGLVESYKKRYRIVRGRAGRPSVSLLFVMGRELFVRYEWGSYRHRIDQFLHALETECARANVNLHRHIIGLDESASNMRRVWRSFAGRTQGVIAWQSPVIAEHVSALLAHAASAPVPFIVFDDIGDSPAPEVPARKKQYRRVAIGDFAAGQSVGRFLRQHGQGSAAFFASGDAPWARARYEGLCAGMRDAAWLRPGSVRLFQVDTAPRPIGRGQSPKGDSATLAGIAARAESGIVDPSARRRLIGAVSDLRYCSELRTVYAQSFAEALRDRSITAWVCAEDGIAVHAALPFLREAKVRVPLDVSVIGFNDSLELAWSSDLSSFDFGVARIVNRMVSAIARPELAYALDTEDAGRVVERGTTACASPGL